MFIFQNKFMLKKKFFKSFILIIILLVYIIITASGQNDKNYKLLTEKYIERPLAMHKGQLQIISGYEFSIINRKYDQNGDKIDLTIDGSVSARHLIPFELKYGLLEFIQFSAQTKYASTGIRTQNHNTISTEGVLYVSELKKYTGMYDIFLGLDITPPLNLKFLNCIVSAGVYLPAFSQKPDKPDHSYTLIESDPGSAILKYKYYYKNSTGIPLASFGSAIKFKITRFSFTGMFNYSLALKDGDSFDWNFRLVNNEFEYEKETYQYNTGHIININGEAAWQAIDWFAIRSSFMYHFQSGGWSNLTGKKVGYPEISLASLIFGYEILVSPLLRIEQQIIFPVAGKNINGQWAFLSGINFNMFTSGKNK